MKRESGWARARASGAHMLRRGAWYPVVGDPDSKLVVLNVSKKNIPIPRDLLDVREDLPRRASVVMRSPEDPNPVRGTPQDLGLVYAVCPATRARIAIEGQPPELKCPACGEKHELDWTDPC